MLLLLIFIAVPIIEIAAFIEVGGLIGLWPTLGCVVLTAVIGTFLLRQQGLSVLRRAQDSVQNNQIPMDSVMHGAFLLFAGALLLTPGFFTDAVGFALLVPPIRVAIARFAWSRMKDKVRVHHSGFTMGGERQGPADRTDGAGPVIEGEAVEVEDREKELTDRTNGAGNRDEDETSPWTR